MTKLVILDRDGVINFDSPNFIKSPEEWHPIPGSLDAIARLNKAGFKVALATNQSGIARGLYDQDILDKIHAKMNSALREASGHIDAIFYCPHGPDEACTCRKPKTGLFEQIASYFKIDFKKNPIPCIGDSLRDLEAAHNLGCRPILVLTGNGPQTLEKLPDNLRDIDRFQDLAAATDALLGAKA